MRVLIIDKTLAEAGEITAILNGAGIKTFQTVQASKGISHATHYHYDVLIVSDELEGMESCALIEEMRRLGVKTPILILNREQGHHEERLIDGLRAGADLYLRKPFSPDFLTAITEEVARRYNSHVTPTIKTGALSVDINNETVTVHGKEIHLTRSEYQILTLLCSRKNILVSKNTILNHLYGDADKPAGNIVTKFVCDLREKIRNGTNGPDYIETVPRQGYRLKDPKQTQRKEALELISDT